METNTPLYRKYQTEDLETLKKMMKDFYQSEQQYEGLEITDEKITQTVEALDTHPDKGSVYIFELGGQIAGYAITINYWRNGYGGNVTVIDEFFVSRDYRRNGLGKGFLQFLENDNPDQSVAISLQVFPSNIQAHEFYEKMGFNTESYRYLLKWINQPVFNPSSLNLQ